MMYEQFAFCTVHTLHDDDDDDDDDGGDDCAGTEENSQVDHRLERLTLLVSLSCIVSALLCYRYLPSYSLQRSPSAVSCGD